MRGRASALAVLLAVNILNIYDRQVLGALAEPVRFEFGLSDMQIGALSTLFTLFYACAGVPIGRLADRASRRRLLAAAVALWGALTAVGGLAATYALLLASRLGVGIGQAVCAPAGTSWIGDLFPPERRSRALAVFMLGVPLGVALSFAAGGPIGQAFGWRAAMVIAGVPAALLAPALLLLPEPVRGAAEKSAAAPLSVMGLLRLPAFLWIVASGALLNFCLYTIATFLPAFLTRFHGLSVAQAGIWAGVGCGAAGLLGAWAAGVWGDRRPGAGPRLRAAALASFAAAPAGFAGILLPQGTVVLAIVLLMTGYALLQTYYGLVYSAIQDLVAPSLRGTAMALYFLAMYLSGGAFGPMLTGHISDILARRAAAAGALAEAAKATGLHDALYIVPLLCLGLGAVLWAGSRAGTPRPR